MRKYYRRDDKCVVKTEIGVEDVGPVFGSVSTFRFVGRQLNSFIFDVIKKPDAQADKSSPI
jgi:hypothetical protein